MNTYVLVFDDIGKYSWLSLKDYDQIRSEQSKEEQALYEAKQKMYREVWLYGKVQNSDLKEIENES